MNSFSDITKQKLQYYVYALIDPRNNEIFYVGKGINDRVFQHEWEKETAIESEKHLRINAIKESGNAVKKVILLYGLTEESAFASESALINLLNYTEHHKLTNIMSGHHAEPVMTVEEFELFHGAELLTEKDIQHNLLVIKINALYEHGMSDDEIKDCARGHWVINIKNASKADYLVAVYHGIVVGVYENMQWYPSGKQTEFYPYLSEKTLAMTKRKYCTCTSVPESKYLGKNISALVKTAQNPISYIWGKKAPSE